MADLTKRLRSLDVFRGLTIAGMMLVNSPGNGTAYAPLEHAEWNGWTPTDLVFPFFLFIVGVSAVFAFQARRLRGASDFDLSRQVFRRTAIIFGLGLLLNGFPTYHLGQIRILGVLQRISLCYLLAAFLNLRASSRDLWIIFSGLLVGYWLAMTRIPVPGFGAGDLSKAGNLAAYLDRRLLAGHTYTPDYDPEGLLSTLPALATTILGLLTGRFIVGATEIDSRRKKVGWLVGAGVAALAFGQLWNISFPINKALWTSSYVLFTGGIGLVLFAACYWWVEIRGGSFGVRFFETFGVNAIIAYVVSIFILKIMNRIPISNPDGTAGNLRLFVTRHLFEGWASPEMASLLFAVSYTAIWFFILRALYNRRIFIKI